METASIMTPEQSVVACAVHAWKLNVERADTLFSGLSEQQLLKEVAPGKNRLVPLWGPLVPLHPPLLPLLGLRPPLPPELGPPVLPGAHKPVTHLPSPP